MPLVADCERHAELVRDLDHLRGCREALRPWFAELKGNLLDRRLMMWQAELARLDNRLERVRVREQQKQQRLQRDELARAMYDNGGHRVGAIKAEMARLDAQHQEKPAARASTARWQPRLAWLARPTTTASTPIAAPSRRAMPQVSPHAMPAATA